MKRYMKIAQLVEAEEMNDDVGRFALAHSYWGEAQLLARPKEGGVDILDSDHFQFSLENAEIDVHPNLAHV